MSMTIYALLAIAAFAPLATLCTLDDDSGNYLNEADRANAPTVSTTSRYLCCGPRKYETTLYQNSDSWDGRNFASGILSGPLAFDWAMQRIAYSPNFVYDLKHGMQNTSKYITDYKQGKTYVIRGDKCMIVRFKPFSLPPPCVPASAKKVYHSYMGTGSAKLAFDSYNIKWFPTATSTYSITKGCTPMGDLIIGKFGGSSVMMEIGYNQFNKGIRDPSVLVPPPSCRHPVDNLEIPALLQRSLDMHGSKKVHEG